MSRQHFGDVQHLRRGIATPAQPPFDIQHAAQIAEHHCLHVTRRDVGTLALGDMRRNVAVLD